MKELELNISKVLIGSITVEEFESIIYQEYYVEKMESNDFITSVITINYRDESWKNDLEKLIYNLWSDSKYLTYLVRKYCVQIIASKDKEKVFSIVNDLARLNTEYGYEYGTLVQFYLFDDEVDLITIGYNTRNKKELLLEIKAYSKSYIAAYDSNVDCNILLDLKEIKPKTIGQNETFTVSNSVLKSEENKKRYQFWKLNYK